MNIDVDKILAEIKKAVSLAKNEEDLRVRISNILENEILKKFDIPVARYEYTFVSGGRADAFMVML